MCAWVVLICLWPALAGCPTYPAWVTSWVVVRTAYVDAPVGSSRTHHVKRSPQTRLAKAKPDINDAKPAVSSDAQHRASPVNGVKPTVSSDAQHRPSPDVGTPEWDAQQAEEARQQKRLDEALKSICRGC